MSKIINVGLSHTDLNVEKKDQYDENYECKALHGVILPNSGPINAQVCNLK